MIEYLYVIAAPLVFCIPMLPPVNVIVVPALPAVVTTTAVEVDGKKYILDP